MDSEDKKIVWISGLLLTTLVAVLLTVAAWHFGIIKTYVNAGYDRTTLPGVSCTYWVKDVNDR